MTSVFMVLEVSGNYSVILPVIVANTFAYVISRRLQPTAIFDWLTRQDGLNLPSMEKEREKDVLTVEDAMRHTLVPVSDSDDTLAIALQQLNDSQAKDILVRFEPGEWASVSQGDIEKLVREGKGTRVLLQRCRTARFRTCIRTSRWRWHCDIYAE